MAAGTATSRPAKCTTSTSAISTPHAREMKVTPATPTAIVCGSPMMKRLTPCWIRRWASQSPDAIAQELNSSPRARKTGSAIRAIGTARFASTTFWNVVGGGAGGWYAGSVTVLNGLRSRTSEEAYPDGVEPDHEPDRSPDQPEQHGHSERPADQPGDERADQDRGDDHHSGTHAGHVGRGFASRWHRAR